VAVRSSACPFRALAVPKRPCSVSSLPPQNRACGSPAHGSPPSSRHQAFHRAAGVGSVPKPPSLRGVVMRVCSLAAIPLPRRWAAHSARGPSLRAVVLSAPSSLLWPPPTPAPLSPVSPLITTYRARRSQHTSRVALGSSLLGRRRVSPVPTMAVPPFHALYAAGFFGAALQGLHPFHGLRLNNPGSAPGWSLAGGYSRRGRLRFMLRTGGLHPPREGLTPRFDPGISPDAGGLLQRRLGPSFGRTHTG